MTDTGHWRPWRNTPLTTPGGDTVVRLPQPDWVEIEREIIDARNELVHWQAEAAKVEAGFTRAVDRLGRARERFAARATDLGAKVTFAEHPADSEER